MRKPPLIRFLAALFALSLVAAACGDDDDTSAGDSTTTTAAGDNGGDDSTSTTAGAPEAAPGFDGTTIKLGILVPLSGLASLIGNPLAAGQEAYWAYVNDQGGIAGKYPVEVVLEDTLYEVNTTVQKYNKIKGDVVMLAQVMGTPHNQALLPLLNDDNIVSAPASQDSIWIREQHMLPIIEPYQIDVINALDYYLNEGGGTTDDTFCAVVENDVYGDAGQEGFEFAADQFGFDVAEIAKFKLGDTDFTAQVSALKAANCDMVFATALPSEFNGIITTADNLDFAPRWIGQSPAWVDEFAATDLAPYYQEHVWIVAVGPEWGDTSYPGVQELMDRLQRYRPQQEPDYYFSFGNYQAVAVQQVLEKAVANGDLSRDGIVEAMNSIDVLDFGGIIGDYTYGPPEDRDPPRVSSVFEIDPAKPFALGALKVNFSSDAAKAYAVPGGA